MEKVVATPREPAGYSQWSIEELRRFALQMRVRDARTKNRRELIELLEPVH